MKKPISISLMALLLPVVALSNEPSAFSAGDVNSPNPYGLTTSEKKILQSNQKVSEVKAELGSVTEQLEGMRSVLDGYNTKIAKMDERMRKLEEYVEENRQIQEENQEKVKAVLSELGSLIDSINKNYVTKAQFDKLAAELKSKASTSSSKADEKVKAPTPNELAVKDSATLMKEADDFFAKSAYAEAKVRYDELLKRNYKPAKINFTLGEIAYSKKSYSAAIEYYKSSIALFDKAAYTPTLLFHTGSSFDKLGKKKEAQNFYKALKEGYPDSPEAKKVK